jgi:hypothetical protein
VAVRTVPTAWNGTMQEGYGEVEGPSHRARRTGAGDGTGSTTP